MTDRCEPPPELSGKDGWHWVRDPDGAAVVGEWGCRYQGWHGNMPNCPDWAWQDGWRYVAPVAAPEEVASLRAQRDELAAEIERIRAAASHQGEAHALRASIKMLADTARAAGFLNRPQESNAEMVGRALRQMAQDVGKLQAECERLDVERYAAQAESERMQNELGDRDAADFDIAAAVAAEREACAAWHDQHTNSLRGEERPGETSVGATLRHMEAEWHARCAAAIRAREP